MECLKGHFWNSAQKPQNQANLTNWLTLAMGLTFYKTGFSWLFYPNLFDSTTVTYNLYSEGMLYQLSCFVCILSKLGGNKIYTFQFLFNLQCESVGWSSDSAGQEKMREIAKRDWLELLQKWRKDNLNGNNWHVLCAVRIGSVPELTERQRKRWRSCGKDLLL